MTRPFERRLGELTPASDLVWFIALNTGLVFTLIAAFPFAGTESGKFWAYAGLMIRASLYLWAGDSLRGRGGEMIAIIFRLGIVAGIFELLVDWGLIHWVSSGKLVYLTGNDIVLLGSPVWMPLAWACVIVELGYPAVRLYSILAKRSSPRPAAAAASLVVAVFAGVTVGFYEYFAYRAGWWKYQPAHAMIGNFCALFVPLGELLMFLPVIPIVASAVNREERPYSSAIVGGSWFALSIAAGYTIAYLALER